MSNLIEPEVWRDTVSATDNLSHIPVAFDGATEIEFDLPSGWNIGLGGKADHDLTDARVSIDGSEYLLTRAAITRIAIEVGLTARYLERTPGILIATHLNYWADHSPNTLFGLLVSPTVINDEPGTVHAVVKKALNVFPNAEVLGAVEDRLGAFSNGGEFFVDAERSHHSLDLTVTRYVLPEAAKTLSTARSEADVWWGGVQVTNSLTGRYVTGVEGYLWSKYGDHGVITTHAAQHYNRRAGHNLSDVLEWLPEATQKVADTIDYETETIEVLVEEKVDPGKMLADVFRTYKVPLRMRNVIIENLENGEDATYYGVMNAISQAANTPEIDVSTQTTLMEIAGEMAHDSSQRCSNCMQVIA